MKIYLYIIITTSSPYLMLIGYHMNRRFYLQKVKYNNIHLLWGFLSSFFLPFFGDIKLLKSLYK